TALETSRQRERELAQRVFEKRASDERSDAEQAPPDPRSQSETLEPTAPSLAARPEDSNAFRGSSARESVEGGIVEDAKGYSYSLIGSPRAASSRSRAITEVCEAKLRMMEGSLRELESGKAAALEEEILRTDAKLEELGRLADAAARDLQEDFEQAMELLQSTRRVKEHMLVDHRQQLDNVAERIAALRSARDDGVKACEAADHAEMVAFLSKHASTYSQECWQLLARPLPRSIQVPLDDIPFEVAKRRELLREAQCSEKLVSMKNEVLCDIVDALRAERSTHADTREYAVEVESLLEAYATEWEERFDYACLHCGQVLEAALANAPYCEATPGRKRGGLQAHHWVPTDTAVIAEAKETARPQLPVAAASPRLKSQAKIRAISPMFRADSSVDGSPASHSARRRDDSPRIDGVLEIDKFMKLFDVGDHQLDMR
ncbi:hypothetical protein FOZ63_023004, partial [Perkinsus olseni]